MHCCSSNKEDLCVSRVPIFKTLTYLEQLDISNLAKSKKFLKGSYLFNQGDLIDSLYIINKGKIKIMRYSLNGDEQVIRVLKDGDFLGEKSLFKNSYADNFAIFLEDTSLCTISSSDLKKALIGKEAISFKIIEELSDRLYQAENTIENINLYSVTKRIADSLLKFKTNKIILPMSKSDYASSLGMSKETLSRKLSEFQNNKIIKLNGQREIIILSKDKLEELSYE